jgi:hypothetical protein
MISAIAFSMIGAECEIISVVVFVSPNSLLMPFSSRMIAIVPCSSLIGSGLSLSSCRRRRSRSSSESLRIFSISRMWSMLFFMSCCCASI